MSCNDLIIAFFPCIYFSAASQMNISFGCRNFRNYSQREKTEAVLQRSKNRERFFRLAVLLISVALIRKIPLIMENPWSEQTFLKTNFVLPPTIVDNNRQQRGDYFRKPTAYWFVNIEPTYGQSFQKPKETKVVFKCKGSAVGGVCSEERSLISPDYARNFICDFILGKPQPITTKSLFDL